MCLEHLPLFINSLKCGKYVQYLCVCVFCMCMCMRMLWFRHKEDAYMHTRKVAIVHIYTLFSVCLSLSVYLSVCLASDWVSLSRQDHRSLYVNHSEVVNTTRTLTEFHIIGGIVCVYIYVCVCACWYICMCICIRTYASNPHYWRMVCVCRLLVVCIMCSIRSFSMHPYSHSSIHIFIQNLYIHKCTRNIN